ncbi:uncharacterized protein LOC121862491 [Homarus americanus]|uniref:uncharacterized protein LOC121862491 n=1 Tax=Homarus americanus TaxID=6706 RepID=UPI001C43BE3D|nr:uncharacterized protein LOC121862491 [Homarus americanus]
MLSGWQIHVGLHSVMLHMLYCVAINVYGKFLAPLVKTSLKMLKQVTAKGLANVFAKLETAIMTEVWDCILTCFNATSKSLQDDRMDLNTAVKDLKSLKSFVLSLRDHFGECEESGVKRNNYQSEVTRVQQRNRRLDYDSGFTSANETVLSPWDKFKVNTYIPILDQLVTLLDQCVEAYQLLSQRFHFFSKIGSDDSSPEAIRKGAQELVSVYSQDFEASLGDELVQLSQFVLLCQDEKTQEESNELFMYRIIKDKGLSSTFPNAEIMLRIFLSLMVSNSSGERTFLKLKLIKNELRSAISQPRLQFLSLMSIESDILRKLNFDYIIDEFSRKKARKVFV